MEVKEIIEYLEKHKPIPLFARSKEDYNEYIGKDIEKIDKMITLLKSLEAENKKYKNILKELEQARGKRIGKNMSNVSQSSILNIPNKSSKVGSHLCLVLIISSSSQACILLFIYS